VSKKLKLLDAITCPEEPHKCPGGIWWHELTLEERAIEAINGIDEPWALEALEVVGEPVFVLTFDRVKQKDYYRKSPEKKLTLTLRDLEEIGNKTLAVAEYLRAYIEKEPDRPSMSDIGEMFYHLRSELIFLEGLLGTLVELGCHAKPSVAT
jgi:hypothetical protein